MFPSASSLGACRSFVDVVRALLKLLHLRPDVVISAGGQAAYPTCVAAAMLRKPLVLIEPHVFPGLINRMMMPFACIVLTAFKTPPRWVPPEKCARRQLLVLTLRVTWPWNVLMI